MMRLIIVTKNVSVTGILAKFFLEHALVLI